MVQPLERAETSAGGFSHLFVASRVDLQVYSYIQRQDLAERWLKICLPLSPTPNISPSPYGTLLIS